MSVFTRKLGNKIITITVREFKKGDSELDTLNGKPTKKFIGATPDHVLRKLGFDDTFDEFTNAEMLERRRLFAKKMFDEANFTKDEAEKLANLTTKLSDYSGNYADGLFYEFVNELDKSGGLQAYRNSYLTDEERTIRTKKASELLEKIKARRNASIKNFE